jgi:ribose transport system ATP-binding protein
MGQTVSDENVILRMQGMVKDFVGTRALDHVDFDVRRAEVHALIGENGAGKSTLMNILAGRFGSYEGQILFDGKPVRIINPRQARDLGIAVIYQELRVLPNFTVAENIMLGEEKAGRWLRRMDRAFVRNEARKVIDYLRFDLDTDEPVWGMSTARQCMVEIAGAVRRNAKLFIFDEPTASLGSEDVDRLFTVIRDLRSRQLAVVYISHRLSEIPAVADRVTVLRDAKKVGTEAIADCPVSVMSHMMLGHSLPELFPRKTNRPGRRILTVSGLTRPGQFENIRFDLHEGEVLGIAGLVGSGRTEIARAIFGADRASGTVEFMGATLARRTPKLCCGYGIGMLCENRKAQGNITARSVAENLNISVLDRLAGALGFQSPTRLARQARAMIEQMEIDPPRLRMPIQDLSGGNQQKVILGRWLAARCKVLILDEPTQGIDIGTKAQFYKLIVALAEAGCGIILVSSEFIELVKLADRILVVLDGRLQSEMKGPFRESDIDVLFERCLRKRESA